LYRFSYTFFLKDAILLLLLHYFFLISSHTSIYFHIMLPINQIKETCLYVKDLTASKVFYHDLLGFPIIGSVANRHVFFRAGSSILLCFNATTTKNDTKLPPHFGEGQLHFAFEVPNDAYEDWKKHITQNNILIEKEVIWRKNLKSFYFRDPDKHCVEIVMVGIWD